MDSSSAVVAFEGEWIGTVVDSVTGTAYPMLAGDLFRDLGRQMMVADAAGAHVALYREAMPQNNVAAEGVVLDSSVWLRVWAADGSNVKVARLG